MTNNIQQIKLLLKEHAAQAENLKYSKARAQYAEKSREVIFFKIKKGDYAEHDQFIGVTNPVLHKIAKDFKSLSLDEIKELIASPINEERLLALFILVDQYKKSSNKDEIYQFYLDNLQHINNWNLVDASAHLIIGMHLINSNDKQILMNLVQSDILWERRIAMVSTWYFIRNNQLDWTFKLAEILLKDKHDLIHKAVGRMLREAGKKDESQLIAFLDQYADRMPRTMLRYAIEKFPEEKRKGYLVVRKIR